MKTYPERRIIKSKAVRNSVVDNYIELTQLIEEFEQETAAILKRREQMITPLKSELLNWRDTMLREVDAAHDAKDNIMLRGKKFKDYQVEVTSHGTKRVIHNPTLLRKIIGEKVLAARAKLTLKDVEIYLDKPDYDLVMSKTTGPRRIKLHHLPAPKE